MKFPPNHGHLTVAGASSSSVLGKRRRVGLVYDERMCKHSTPVKHEVHPENPDRIRAIWNKLMSAGIPQKCVVFNAKEVEDKYIAAVHTTNHINLIKTISSIKPASQRNRVATKYDSIYFNEGSSESAYLAAGSVLEVAEKVAKGELDSAFAIVRPPGHHAEKCEPMGFCLYNNVAIATSFLLDQKELGINKILIVDWDVHHGNGTQKMFWKDPRVLVFSVHRHDNGKFYPTGDDGSHIMMGEGPGAGYNINVPWENGQYGDADYFAVWDHILIPVAKEFNPDIIIISAGFDAAIGDPLGGCRVTPHGYSIMLKKLMEFGGKIVLALEGGYNLKSLANSVSSCVQVLLGDKPIVGSMESYPFESTWAVIKTVREQFSAFWPILADKLPAKLTSRLPPQLQSGNDRDGFDTLSEDLQVDVTMPLLELDLSGDARGADLRSELSKDDAMKCWLAKVQILEENLSQQLTANANLASDNLAKVKTLSDKNKELEAKDQEIEALKRALAREKHLKDTTAREQLEEANEEHRLLISKGIPHFLYTLLRSDEFRIALAKVLELSYQLGRQQALEEIQKRVFPDVSLENIKGYDGTVLDRYEEAYKEFTTRDYPYLKEIAANADKPLEFLMNIKPKKHANAESYFENKMGHNGIKLDRILNEACKLFSEMEYPYIKKIVANADKPWEFIMNIEAD